MSTTPYPECATCGGKIINVGELIELPDGKKFCDDACFDRHLARLPRHEEIDAWFSEGDRQAKADEETGAHTECPYPDKSVERHWWTRGSAYVNRLLRALKAEKELERLKASNRQRSVNEKLVYKRAIEAEAIQAQFRATLEHYANEIYWDWCACRKGNAAQTAFVNDGAPGYELAQEALGPNRGVKPSKVAQFTEVYRIERVHADPLYEVRLKVGGQSFTIFPDQIEDLHEAEWFQRQLIIALTNLIDQYSPNQRIEDLKKKVKDRDGWIAQYRWNRDQIGEMLAPFREIGHTGEPARSDVEEIRALIQRMRNEESRFGALDETISQVRVGLDKAEEIAKEASLQLEDDTHDYDGCRFTGATEVTCRVCLAQDRLAEIRAETLIKSRPGTRETLTPKVELGDEPDAHRANRRDDADSDAAMASKGD
jgi:hypothetical protein